MFMKIRKSRFDNKGMYLPSVISIEAASKSKGLVSNMLSAKFDSGPMNGVSIF